MTYSVQVSGSFREAAPTTPSDPETRSHTYRVLAPSPAAAEAVARQLLIADAARIGRCAAGEIDAAAAG